MTCRKPISSSLYPVNNLRRGHRKQEAPRHWVQVTFTPCTSMHHSLTLIIGKGFFHGTYELIMTNLPLWAACSHGVRISSIKWATNYSTVLGSGQDANEPESVSRVINTERVNQKIQYAGASVINKRAISVGALDADGHDEVLGLLT